MISKGNIGKTMIYSIIPNRFELERRTCNNNKMQNIFYSFAHSRFDCNELFFSPIKSSNTIMLFFSASALCEEKRMSFRAEQSEEMNGALSRQQHSQRVSAAYL